MHPPVLNAANTLSGSVACHNFLNQKLTELMQGKNRGYRINSPTRKWAFFFFFQASLKLVYNKIYKKEKDTREGKTVHGGEDEKDREDGCACSR